MTAQEVREHLSKLPEQYRSQALKNYIANPNIDVASNPNRGGIVMALHYFVWGKTPQGYEYWKEVSRLANDGEFDTPQPDDDAMISVSSRHYNDISEKANKYDRMAEIVKENAQNKKDEH